MWSDITSSWDVRHKPLAASNPRFRSSCPKSLPKTKAPSAPAFEAIVKVGACEVAKNSDVSAASKHLNRN